MEADALHTPKDNSIYLLKVVFLVSAALIILLIAVYHLQQIDREAETSLINKSFIQAKEQAIRGNYDEAVDILRGITKRDPFNSRAYLMLGICYSGKGMESEALDCFNKAMGTGALSEQVYYNLGNHYLKRRNIDKAIYYYSESILFNKDYIPPRYMLAQLYELTGKRESAVREYERILKIEMGWQKNVLNNNLFGKECYKRFFSAKNAFNKGFLYEKRGDLKRAMLEYDKAVELQPNFARAYYRRALIHCRSGNFRKAEKEFKKAILMKPQAELLKGARGDVFFRLGMFEQAYRIYESLSEALPVNIVIKDYLGGIFLERGEYEKAEHVFRSALRQEPEYTRAYEGLGLACLKLARYEEAENNLRKAVSLSPESPDAYYNLACLYSRIGRIPEAMKWLKMSIDKGFKDTEYILSDPDLEKLRNNIVFKQSYSSLFN